MKVRTVFAAVLVGMLGVSTVTPARAAAINPGDWFVSDYQDWGNGSVIHLDSDGTVIEAKGNFYEPRGLDFGPDGHLYMSDKNDDVTQFLKSEFQTTAVVITTLNGPGALEFGPNGYLFSANGGLGSVQRFNGPYEAPAWGGQVPVASISLGSPGGIAFGPNGKLYVSDNGNAGQIESYTGLYPEGHLGLFVDDSANFGSASAITFGPDRNLYVSVNSDGEILRYQGPNGASPGTLIDTFVTAGTGGLATPNGIAFGADGNLYVCQAGTANVLRFQGPYGDTPGAFIDVFVTLTGKVPVFLTQAPVPNPINPGDWFVGDYTEWKGYVYHFDPDGKFIESQKNGYHETRGMDIGPDGKLYVADNYNRIVQFSDTDFQAISTVVNSGIGGAFDLEYGPDDNIFLACRDTGDVRRWNGPSNAPPFSAMVAFASLSPGRPLGVAFGPDGNLYAADSDTAGLIKKYDGTTGTLLGTFVSDSGNFDDGFDIDFGPDGNLYVSDLGGAKILSYQGPNGGSPGTFISTFVSAGGSLTAPAGIEFGSDGDLYVCNYPGTKVLRYQGPNGASPGTFVSEFMELDAGRQPWFLTQAPGWTPPPPPDTGTVILIE